MFPGPWRWQRTLDGSGAARPLHSVGLRVGGASCIVVYLPYLLVLIWNAVWGSLVCCSCVCVVMDGVAACVHRISTWIWCSFHGRSSWQKSELFHWEPALLPMCLAMFDLGMWYIISCYTSDHNVRLWLVQIAWCKLIWDIDRFTGQYFTDILTDRHIDRSEWSF